MHQFMRNCLQDVVLPIKVWIRNGRVVQKVGELVEDEPPVLHGAAEAVDIDHVHLIQGVGHVKKRLQGGHTLGANLCRIIRKTILKINIINKDC